MMKTQPTQHTKCGFSSCIRQQTSRFSSLLFLCLIVSLLLSSGCSSTKVAGPSGFVGNYSGLAKGTYFNQERVARNVDFKEFKAVKVAPISLSYMADKTACDTTELEKLGREFREAIEEKLRASGLVVTSNPSGRTLVVSLAITNVEPPDALLNAGLAAATLMMPVPLPFDKDGETSFEGKITDGTTGKVLIEFAETRIGAGSQTDLTGMTTGKFQKFTNTHIVFTRWAETIAKMIKELTQGAKPAA
ncbi:MAG: DUF3313 family protein [Verrucomicrobia bacterium]|nr:DUF3313 family protein [Verrucomicrobiota bacterium]